ncbi:hypothetical protein NDI44_28335 [Trichocoleus sp. DQ-A3]
MGKLHQLGKEPLHVARTSIVFINHLLELVEVIHPAFVQAYHLGKLYGERPFQLLGFLMLVPCVKCCLSSQLAIADSKPT